MHPHLLLLADLRQRRDVMRHVTPVTGALRAHGQAARRAPAGQRRTAVLRAPTRHRRLVALVAEKQEEIR